MSNLIMISIRKVNQPFKCHISKLINNSRRCQNSSLQIVGGIRNSSSVPSNGSMLKSGSLNDLKVLDLTRILAGPFCTMMLADLGANVIKVEKPGTGDETRLWGPPYVNTMSCYFLAVNRNKKSIAIDLKSKEGIAIVQKLAESSDVLVENYLPGKLDAMGLGYDHLKKINPKLVYASITGFGPDGPYSTRAGYDVIAASMGGLLSITGPEDGEPCKVGVAITDITTGLYANGAILAALHQRSKTGEGCKIDCNLLSSQVSVLVNLGVNYLNTGIKAPKRGTAHETVVPYQSFQCEGNRYLTIGAGSDKMFKKLCQILFGPEESLSSDERFINNAARAENRITLVKLLTEKFKTRSIEYWMNQMQGSGIAFGPVNELDEVFKDPQVIHNQAVIQTEHPINGPVKLLGPPVQYKSVTNDKKAAFRDQTLPPPLLGEHTVHVLKTELNYSDEEIKELKSKGIIQF